MKVRRPCTSIMEFQTLIKEFEFKDYVFLLKDSYEVGRGHANSDRSGQRQTSARPGRNGQISHALPSRLVSLSGRPWRSRFCNRIKGQAYFYYLFLPCLSLSCVNPDKDSLSRNWARQNRFVCCLFLAAFEHLQLPLIVTRTDPDQSPH